MKICVTCQLPKEEEEFNWRYKALGIRAKICRECQSGHQRTWYQDHQEQEKERVRRRRVKARELAREYVWNYKSSHPCSQCGVSDPVVLDFHHVRGKGANVGKLIMDGASIERIKVEITLCIILCSNCHRKLTASERRKWW
jgi:hypothetical protein